MPAERPTGRMTLGLALGGGAVRGAAHVGVMAVLEREGIRPDVISGTSIGAVVGAAFAAGISSAEVLQRFRTSSWSHVARPTRHLRLSMAQASPLADLVRRATHAETFSDLEIPLAVVASDILTGETVMISEGPLVDAIMASAAIPLLFEPVRRNGRLLVDGGLTDNVPVDAARSLGADYVIAVDVVPALDGTYEPEGLRDIAILSLAIMQHRVEGGLAEADLVIAPDVAHLSPSDFSRVNEAYEAGVAAAEAALPKLLGDLHARDERQMAVVAS